jgi:hypothetical protein
VVVLALLVGARWRRRQTCPSQKLLASFMSIQMLQPHRQLMHVSSSERRRQWVWQRRRRQQQQRQ